MARAKYLSPDRPDTSYAVKGFANAMSKPTKGDWAKLKSLGRYLIGRPRLQTVHPWQHATREMIAYTDADWAGDKINRKSTLGGCVMMGEHVLKCWSKTQSLIAPNSGESELYATLRTAPGTLGMIAMANDLGIKVRDKVWGDASAALAIIHRTGLGRTRHIDVGHLWVRQVTAERRLQFSKVMGRDRPADLFTKYLDQRTMDRHVEKLKGRYVNGRPSSALALHSICVAWAKYTEDARETRTSWRSVVEAELQMWLKAQVIEVAKRASDLRAMDRTDKHVPRKQCKYPQGGANANTHNTTTQCHANSSTIRPWRKDSLPGETQGQFLTRKYREFLKIYATIDKDR